MCIRDHFDELSPSEISWCIETMCAAVEHSADDWNQIQRVQIGAMAGDRPTARILPSLLIKPLDSTSTRDRVLKALLLAITHPIHEVRANAAAGIGDFLWPTDRKLAKSFINTLATSALLAQNQIADEEKKPYDKRTDLDQIERDVAVSVRSKYFEQSENDDYKNLDISDWIGARENCHILSILVNAHGEKYANDIFQRQAHVIAQWWDDDDSSRTPHDSKSKLTDLLNRYIIYANTDAVASMLQPILEMIDEHPRDVSFFIQGIIVIEDQMQQTEQFWAVWELFAQRVRSASWLPQIAGEDSYGGILLETLFLTTRWKNDVRHWRSLEGHSHRVHDLFMDLEPSTVTISSYIRFLYHIGEQSLPESFEKIASKLRAVNAQHILMDGNTIFMLEMLLSRNVYGRPFELKRTKDLRDSVLFLLDLLVDKGSSASYRMRDDFITPLSSGN